MQLDPNAQSYTDDEIVGKVNAATAKVDADQLQDGTTNKVFTGTEQSKLSSVEDNATADQDAIVLWYYITHKNEIIKNVKKL